MTFNSNRNIVVHGRYFSDLDQLIRIQGINRLLPIPAFLRHPWDCGVEGHLVSLDARYADEYYDIIYLKQHLHSIPVGVMD